MGPGPENFSWSPEEALLTYTYPQDGEDALWLYDASSGGRRVILDPAGQPDNIDVTSAQWSLQGGSMLLSGDDSLWLLDVASGERVSFVRDNDIYAARLSGRPTGWTSRAAIWSSWAGAPGLPSNCRRYRASS